MITKATTYHVPVLLKESVDGLNIKPDGIYIDVTFGGGGHSREILSRLGENGHLYSFDQDADAEGNLGNRYEVSGVNGETEKNDKNAPNGDTGKPSSSSPSPFTFVRSNFRYLKNWMRYYGVDHIDGLLGDLGVSSHHFDDESRGFSFRFDAPLDMRMNKRAGKTAADVVNTYEEERLADIFYLYGELKTSRRIAATLVNVRKQKQILTTQDFLNAVDPLFRREREKKDMAKLFQALRIEVNQEMAALKEMLMSAQELLAPGGRLSIITYHSLEDRIVKNIMKSGNAEGKVQQDFFGRSECPFRLINNKVIVPDNEELANNPRSRSAKLRIAEKK
ncbi:MAG: 16S rRNA (cytosine(1402)-N(4))-methyltransferase RsmH [Prevotella sp.]|nr:16S rRNA (cytosine(1402)-N(4))-methyltransferase RsmH [Prevotella sp.]